MSLNFDPYHQWLGIRDPTRPPNHYRLLGVELFESDPDVILTAADRQMAHLRSFQHGEQVELSQRLLNEVSAAKVCLLDPNNKAQYDGQLRATGVFRAPPTPAETPPPRADERDAVAMVVPVEDGWDLKRPGRSSRDPRRRRWIVLSCLVVLAATAGGYALFNLQGWKPTAVTATSPDGPQPQPQPSTGSTPEGPNPAGGDPPSERSEDAPPLDEATQAPEDVGDDPTAQAPAEATSPTSQPPASVESPPSAAWEQPNRLGPRPQFSASDPLGSFLLATSQRDLTAADAVLNALQRGGPRIDPAALSKARLLHFMLQRFWQAVDEARQNLTMGQTISYRQSPVTVVSVTLREIVLEAADGQRRAFDLRRTQVDRDLAIALVEWRFASSLPAAWRMIGSFLAVDQQGDVSRAEQYLQRAEQHGFTSRLLMNIVHRPGKEPHRQPTTVVPLDTDPPTEPVTVGLQAVPGASAQQAARRAILQRLREEVKGPMTATQLGKLLLQRATSVEGDPVAHYVILREALTKANSGGDLQTALSAIDGLAGSYEVDAWKLRLAVLRSLARRTKAGNQQDLAAATARLAHQAVAQDQYDQANRLADLAVALAQATGDELLQQRLQRVRRQIEQTSKLYEASRTASQRLQQDPQDRSAHAQLGRFLCLGKGDFAGGLPHLQQGSDGVLRALAERDLRRRSDAAAMVKLARVWRHLGESKSGDVQQRHAFERARHWYEEALSSAGETEANEIQRQLAEIDKLAAAPENDEFTAEPQRTPSKRGVE